MQDVKIGNLELPLSKLIIAIGTLLVLISLFLAYVTMSGGGMKESLSGFNIITGSVDGESLDGEYWSFVRWAPLFMILTAIVALVLSLLPMFVEIPLEPKIYNIVISVFGAISVLFAIIFIAIGAGPGLFDGVYKETLENSLKWGLEMSRGMGAFLGLIGSLAVLAGSVLGLKENL